MQTKHKAIGWLSAIIPWLLISCAGSGSGGSLTSDTVVQEPAGRFRPQAQSGVELTDAERAELFGTPAKGAAPVPSSRAFGQAGWWNHGKVARPQLVSHRSAARQASLDRRAELRSFEGAPPVMPHSAAYGSGSMECIDCHSVGIKLGNKVGRAMSHPPMANCVQCHIESTNRNLPPPGRVVATSFVGLRSRAVASPLPSGAPPPIPHVIRMRGQCLSCHGEFGYDGLRTSHPERANCIQCHVPMDLKGDRSFPFAVSLD